MPSGNEIDSGHFSGLQRSQMKQILFDPPHDRAKRTRVIAVMEFQGFDTGQTRENALPSARKTSCLDLDITNPEEPVNDTLSA